MIQTKTSLSVTDTECPTCGRKDFKTVKGMKSHHKMTHGESIAGESSTCEWCGEDFRYEPSTGETGRFCSNDCKFDYWDENGRDAEEIEAIKEGLPDDMSHDDDWKQMLSERMTGREIEWSDEIADALEGRERPDLAGENNGNWKGGYDGYYYGPSWTKELRRRVRERDGYECMVCGVAEEDLDRELDVHHIVPFRKFGVENHEKANREDNLVSLCRSCHNQVDSGEVSLPNYDEE
jgi:hypothetical protein